MSFNVNSIVWPPGERESLHYYLGFALKIVDLLGISFPPEMVNPISLTKNYIENNESEEARNSAALVWWDCLEDHGGVQDFQSSDALIARLAICLLGVKAGDGPDLSENVCWLMEVLEFLGHDFDAVFEIMVCYFKP